MLRYNERKDIPCAEDIDRSDGWVLRYVHDVELDASDVNEDEMSVAWWAMVLQGIVWTRRRRPVAKDNAVPLFAYENGTPISIA